MSGEVTTNQKPVMVKAKSMGKDQFFVAICAIFGFFALIAAIIFIPIPSENREIFLIVLGTLSSAFTAAIGFYLGNVKARAEAENAISSFKSLR